MDVADPLEKHARPHICYHTEFGGSKSNRMDVNGGSQFWGYAAPRPLGWGTADRLETRFCTACVTMPNMVILGQTL